MRAAGRWTANPNKALDFKSMNEAVELVEKAGYRNMEVAFVSEDPHRLATVRVEALNALEQ